MDKLIEDLYLETWGKYYIKIRNYCLFQLNSIPNTIEDCCQNVFRAYLEALLKGHHIENVGSWLYKVAYNEVKREQKQAINTPEQFSLDNPENMGTEIGIEVDYIEEIIKNRFSDEQLLHMVSEALSPEENHIFTGCFIHRQDVTALASELNIRVNYLYKKKWLLKNKLEAIVHRVLMKIEDNLATK